MDGSVMYVEKCTGIMSKLEEIITDVQDTQLVAYLLGSSAEATRFVRSLDKDVTLLKDIISILVENLKLSVHHVEVGNIDNLSFEICSKMVNHATAVMLQDSVDDAEVFTNYVSDSVKYDDEECKKRKQQNITTRDNRSKRGKMARDTIKKGKLMKKSKLKSDTVLSDDKTYCKDNIKIPSETEYSGFTKLTGTKHKEFNCYLCEDAHSTKSALNMHLETRHNIKQDERISEVNTKEVCDLCGRIMANKTSLKRHLKWHRGDRPFKCTNCEKSFITKQQLDSHSAGHLTAMPYICHLCGSGFRSKYNLSVHNIRHSEERPHTCETCGRAFKMTGELKAHYQIHTQKRDHACTECGKTFFTKCKLERHFSTHTGQKPHKCSLCGKCFITTDMLQRHQRIHTNELPYSCAHCSRKFRDKSNCNKHMQCCKSRSKDKDGPLSVQIQGDGSEDTQQVVCADNKTYILVQPL